LDILWMCGIYEAMAKHLVDIDDATLRAAQRRLRTRTIKDTVDRALRMAADTDAARVARALDVLGSAPLQEREAAWR
jgi:Arc/MetJ family transcription regulator